MSGAGGDRGVAPETPAAASSAPSVVAAHTLVETLAGLGVREVVLAPGSRSAPLAYALGHAVLTGRHPGLRLHVRVDERDAGFLALGLARAGSLDADRAADEVNGPATVRPPAPVAVVTTSGTAVANLHPAVLEAHHAGVPLLLLTADRPHELRGTGANQTADQVGIFGRAARLALDVPAPTGRPGELTDLRAQLVRAVAAATGARSSAPGPVQVNLAYRDPLVPTAADLELLGGADGGAELADGLPAPALPAVTDVVARGTSTDATPEVLALADEPATVVVAGDGAGDLARRLAEARGWPLLSEVSSGACGGPNLVAAHRLVLSGSSLTAEVRQVVVLGRPTVSRPVQALLGSGARVVVVAPGAEQWPDAARSASVVLAAVPTGWLEAPESASGPWLDRWLAASGAARAVVSDAVRAGGAAGGRPSSLAVAAEVARASAPDDVLVVGSSSPARDLELVAGWETAPAVVANRGLAGIDGTVSTTLGVALGVQAHAPRTVRALLGDLTFLHDVGGLLRGPSEPEVQAQVVVVNDDGGAIFATLEHGRPEHADVFERVFATPHGADLASLCAGYGVPHEAVTTVERLRAVLAHPRPGVSVVEVAVDRQDRGPQGRELARAVAVALETLETPR
ncbi:2-succinyl-6-hydroxy-2,4-cyclohexadiene-1-carboxylic acid synthase/2-oxoglutarate decarboxylase [Sanguibacter keddieii DSM 10542]|uniref:2-succinyl-5-enolpyruvyl-6-hydroxy-3-cyclohexene-1-carboxylate synthase n=1 Tax=Sanguibacter keddieii (strain ATCC 51767 / DSM 10542 / NCFB 3025 / ST-74) TaxID=446469 RepID=D1BBC3_SANKS|nr:2-succinyl-5-enolpyruvyl-6-hydroxy-3-cyclohexene-1-carboxylic-acid synthase [Sanguibacter keddieii]ACZ20689.1 2-succinyl-6-hydroxy-2,4-cyclohexadiene-1-carboxylic acid synthase/2-oxoglutarate decarboxylase [Sanguibacter keddieii DSM 10542]